MLKGKNALITGGVRGIGRAIAEEFCANGANVLLCYRSNHEAAKAVAQALECYKTKVVLLCGDVSSPDHAKEAVKQMKENFGGIDILVNNAGITKDKLLLRMEEEDFKAVIDTNLSGAFYFLKEAAGLMVKQKQGRIINVSSIAGVRGNPGQINYCASKAGIIGMTMSAAKELGRRGITVNAIAPGFIETDMTHVLTEDQKSAMKNCISLGRPGRPEEVARVARFLASEDGSYITGQVISIDGGMNV